MPKWRDSLTEKDIPRNGCVFARVSDNVLESYRFIPFLITISNGVVTEVAGLDFWHRLVLGWDVNELAEWTHHDSTGQHPETFHELFV